MYKTILIDFANSKKKFAIALASIMLITFSYSFTSIAVGCVSNPFFPELNDGRCSFAKNCFPNPGGTKNDCNSTAPNQGGDGESLPPSNP